MGGCGRGDPGCAHGNERDGVRRIVTTEVVYTSLTAMWAVCTAVARDGVRWTVRQRAKLIGFDIPKMRGGVLEFVNYDIWSCGVTCVFSMCEYSLLFFIPLYILRYSSVW